MKRAKGYIILLNLVLLLIYFNRSVCEKEELLEDGHLILLELAPVDPRSLMQGDYMTLRYIISTDNASEDIPKRGYCVVQTDKDNVATTSRLQTDTAPLNPGEYLIKYAAPNKWNINIGAESFFFQEGQGEKFEKAKYGGVKIDKSGNSLLVGLFDEKLKRIE